MFSTYDPCARVLGILGEPRIVRLEAKPSPWRTRRRRRSRGPGEGRRQRGRPPSSGAGATKGHRRVHGDAARPRPRPPAPAAPGPPSCRHRARSASGFPPRQPARGCWAGAGAGAAPCSRGLPVPCARPLRRRAASRAVAAPRLVLRRRRRVRHSEGCFGGATWPRRPRDRSCDQICQNLLPKACFWWFRTRVNEKTIQ